MVAIVPGTATKCIHLALQDLCRRVHGRQDGEILVIVNIAIAISVSMTDHPRHLSVYHYLPQSRSGIAAINALWLRIGVVNHQRTAVCGTGPADGGYNRPAQGSHQPRMTVKGSSIRRRISSNLIHRSGQQPTDQRKATTRRASSNHQQEQPKTKSIDTLSPLSINDLQW